MKTSKRTNERDTSQLMNDSQGQAKESLMCVLLTYQYFRSTTLLSTAGQIKRLLSVTVGRFLLSYVVVEIMEVRAVQKRIVAEECE